MPNSYETKSAKPSTITTSQPFFSSKPGYNITAKEDAGTVVQRQPAAPVQDPKADAVAQGPDLAEPKAKSKLRDALTQLFAEFEGTHVGDKKFDDIKTQKSWDKLKKDEDEAKDWYKIEKGIYDKEKAAYDANKKAGKPTGDKPVPPIPVAVYTTCIDTQRVLLSKAFAAAGLHIQKVGTYDGNMKLKKDTKKSISYGYGTTGMPQAIELGAWHEAKANDPAKPHPERGDIIVMAFRGSSVDKATDTVKYLQSTFVDPGKKKEQIAEGVMAEREKALSDSTEALQALQVAHATDDPNAMAAAEQKVKKANESFKLAKHAAEAAEKSVQKAEADVVVAQKKIDSERAKVDHKNWFQFSHVGFVKSIHAKGDGTESWETFDGGQNVDTADGKKQGAQTTKRTYDPRINEIAGEASQGGTVRWLQGWITVTSLAEPTAEATSEASQ